LTVYARGVDNPTSTITVYATYTLNGAKFGPVSLAYHGTTGTTGIQPFEMSVGGFDGAKYRGGTLTFDIYAYDQVGNPSNHLSTTGTLDDCIIS
jgi:hypothetical protein